MANKKKINDPCEGCTKEQPKGCKGCEHVQHKALRVQDAERMAREVQTNLIAGDLPYERNVYITETKFYLQRSAESMIEAGKRLLVIKEKEKGAFMGIVEDEIGIPYRTAQRFMLVAIKSDNFPRIDFGGVAKLSTAYALAEAPDEDLKELEDKGVLAGRDMDELSRMSVKEMRELIRELKTNAARIGDQISEEKDHEIKAMRREIKRLSALAPNEKDASWSVKYVEDIDTDLKAFDLKLRRFAFDKRILEHPELQQRVVEIVEGMKFRLTEFAEDWDNFIAEDPE